MRVTILGSGTLVPDGLRGPAGYAVESGGTTLLLDSGSGTLRRLAEAGIDYRGIDHLLYTHVHPDHTGDLVPFLLAQRATPGFRRTAPVRVFGPRGFDAFFARVRAAYGRWIEGEDYELRVRELHGDVVRVEGLQVSTFLMRHSVACIGYRIEDARGAAVAYTGDTDTTDEVVRLARGARVLIADCSQPDAAKIDGHLTPGLVGRLAARAGVPAVVLSHLYPACEGVDVAAECRRHYDGEVVVAHDLMVLDIEGGTLSVATPPPAVWPLGWAR